MLKNAFFVAKIGADTAENERNFCQKIGNQSVHISFNVSHRQVLEPGEGLPSK